VSVERERIDRTLELADLVLSPGGGLSANTVRAAVGELADLVRDLAGDQTRSGPPGRSRAGGPRGALGDAG
jgi:hypothetical protein